MSAAIKSSVVNTTARIASEHKQLLRRASIKHIANSIYKSCPHFSFDLLQYYSPFDSRILFTSAQKPLTDILKNIVLFLCNEGVNDLEKQHSI